jgi:hypothetical protein
VQESQDVTSTIVHVKFPLARDYPSFGRCTKYEVKYSSCLPSKDRPHYGDPERLASHPRSMPSFMVRGGLQNRKQIG